jgi:SAM-dependent methyltransferase
MPVDASSLERLVPDTLVEGDATGDETLRLHLERYRFAARHARPGRLLDIACGVGYGTRLLADEARQVSEAVGVDVSEPAVAYARDRYAGPRVGYRCADAYSFQDPDGFDTIVSLETIEHVQDPERLVGNLVRLLHPGGILIASVPTTPSVDVNPHHLRDFSERSFRRLFDAHALVERTIFRQIQPYRVLPLLRSQELRASDLRPNLLAWYCRHPVALLRRARATLLHGFANHYATLVYQVPES